MSTDPNNLMASIQAAAQQAQTVPAPAPGMHMPQAQAPMPQAQAPMPQAPVPQPQAPMPQAPVQQPQAPVLQPQAPVLQPQAPMPAAVVQPPTAGAAPGVPQPGGQAFTQVTPTPAAPAAPAVPVIEAEVLPPETPAAPVPTPPVAQTTAVVLAPAQPPATQPQAPHYVQPAAVALGVEGIRGDFSRSDLDADRIHLVHRTGDLANQFQYLTYVWNKQVQLNNQNEPFFAVVLSMDGYCQEVTSFDSDATPRIFDNELAVQAAGFKMGWNEDCGEFARCADIELLFWIPQGSPIPAQHTFNGQNFATAKYVAFKSAFRGAASPIVAKAEKGRSHGEAVFDNLWEVAAHEKPGQKSRYAAPLFRNPRLVTSVFGEGFREFLASEGLIG